MYLKVTCLLILCLSVIVESKDDKEFKGCMELEKLFKEICKVGGANKEKILSKAAKCYVGMIPEDADKNLKDYFEKKCGPGEDYCDEQVRKRCGPESFEQMDDKQKEGALNFYEKYQKKFGQFCANGLKCLNA